MWQTLRIAGLGVIEEAEIEFGPGFSVLTGETGAGKTMVVTALGLLRGQRTDAGLVRTDGQRAFVEATISADEAAAALIEEAGGDTQDGIIISRSVHAEGRSRASAGGVTVPAALLADITAELVAVHGQSDQQRLVRPDEQRAALDRFARVGDLLDAYRPVYQELRRTQERLEDVTRNSVERSREAEFLRHGLEQFDQVRPEPGEDEQLKADEQRLAHAESLVLAASGAADALADTDTSATTAMSTATEALHAAAGHDSALDSLAQRLNAALIDLTDIVSELHAYGSAIEIDPTRLADIQQRRSAIVALQRRYGPTLDDVFDWERQARSRLEELSNDDNAAAELQAKIAELTAKRDALAAKLSAKRRSGAEELSAKVSAELDALHMKSAQLEVRVSEAAPGPDGADAVEFWFAANSGSPLRPMAKSASGGELSRLMLGLEVVLADSDPVPTLVFDEIDAGIGGRAAVEVGRRLQQLSRHAQVLVVTHLPQVAAFADSHFVVAKDDDGRITRSSVIDLSDDARVEELARMLAGVDSSEAAREHARELLQLARA